MSKHKNWEKPKLQIEIIMQVVVENRNINEHFAM
jgi:hypothetical protein